MSYSLCGVFLLIVVGGAEGYEPQFLGVLGPAYDFNSP